MMRLWLFYEPQRAFGLRAVSGHWTNCNTPTGTGILRREFFGDTGQRARPAKILRAQCSAGNYPSAEALRGQRATLVWNHGILAIFWVPARGAHEKYTSKILST